MNYFTQQQQQMPMYRPQMPPSWSQPIPIVRPVTSLEEVKASPIEFDGSVFYFTDIANKKIYTKCINMDGTVTINLYEQVDPIKADQMIDSSYVTRQEFNNFVNSIQELLNTKGTQSSAAQPEMYNF